MVRAVKAQEDELSMKLRSIIQQLNTLSETITLWNGHLARAENELKLMMQSGIEGSQLNHLLNQKKALSGKIMQMSSELAELKAEFEKIAAKARKQKNKKKFLAQKLEKQKKERSRKIQQQIEMEILEQWHRKK
jgi:flagellar biosynthesis chaperone FliJ